MKTLVLTPHADLLPDTGEVLFAGGWCLTRDMRGLVAGSGLDYRVANYPWDDREKYYQDYLYLISAYEYFLGVISLELNKIHNEQFDKEYWRLVAGPVLYTILCHLLDRWGVVRGIVEGGAFDRAPCISYRPYAFTPNITTDLKPDSHEYNHYLLSAALAASGVNESKLVNIDNVFKAPEIARSKQSKAAPNTLKSAVRPWVQNLAHFIGAGQGNKVFVFNSCLPKRHDLALNLALSSFPVSQRLNRLEMPAVNPSKRSEMNLSPGNGDRFYIYASKMLPELIPVYLLEGYHKLEEGWKKAKWPHRPKSIFTSNAFQFNEVFQHYAATKKSKFGSKLIIGQHGGVSGILKWSFGTDHQLKIADKFISWGWGLGDIKIIPGFVLTNLGKKVQSDKSGCLLLTTVPIKHYSHKGGAWAVGYKQSKAFLSDQLSFYRNLKSDVSENVVLRIFEHLDILSGTEYIDTWRQNFPNIQVDDSKQPIIQALKKARLFIYTYNSTGYLETLSMNFPTIMFWNPSFFETNLEFAKYLDELEEVGIFHRTPESAAAHVNQIWNDVDHWWNSPPVQRKRADFVQNFARQPPSRWLTFFKENLTANFQSGI